MQPKDKRESDYGFNVSDLNLTWLVDSFEDDTINLNLTFNHPLRISPKIKRD